MSKYIFFPIHPSPVLRAAGEYLKSRGYGVVEKPYEGVTHLLLPAPFYDALGNPDGVLRQLSPEVTVVGGNIPEGRFPGHPVWNLTEDAAYVAGNAAITAYCALRLAMMELPVTLRGCRVLIIGWGRIGRCLSALLKAMEADVTVAARKETDRAMAQALGFSTAVPRSLGQELNRYRVVFNTVPAPVLSPEQTAHCREECLKIDLASTAGIAGTHILHARGLPGKDAPESAGKLMAKTVIRLLNGKELSA